MGRVGGALSRKVDDLSDDVREVRQDLRSLRNEIQRTSRKPHPSGS